MPICLNAARNYFLYVKMDSLIIKLPFAQSKVAKKIAAQKRRWHKRNEARAAVFRII